MLRIVTQCYTLFPSWPTHPGRYFTDVLVAIAQQLATHATSVILAVLAFYLSLVSTSLPINSLEAAAKDRAIHILEKKGFEREVLLLKYSVTFRGTDHWLNTFTAKENAYASTNFPFQLVTLYPDFFSKAADDTERAMVLLHEARHLMGENENQAYAYVWKNRKRLGWSLRTHGTTITYATIEQQTRENAPELFNCPRKPWEDCTE
jgi:hypothetical protein